MDGSNSSLIYCLSGWIQAGTRGRKDSFSSSHCAAVLSVVFLERQQDKWNCGRLEGKSECGKSACKVSLCPWKLADLTHKIRYLSKVSNEVIVMVTGCLYIICIWKKKKGFQMEVVKITKTRWKYKSMWVFKRHK